MSDEWRDVPLSEVFVLDNRKLGAHGEEPVILSLSKYDGFVRSADYFDKRIASARLDGYKVVPPEAWAYSTIHIDEGSIARNSLALPGVISPMYTTMRWTGSGHDPRYFEHLLRTPQILRIYSDNAQGSINRRRSLPFKAFASLHVKVPPLGAQRRIVDVVGAVDAHITSLEAERAAVDRVLNGRRPLIPGGQEVPLGEVLNRIDSGRSFGSDGADEDPVRRVLKLSAVRPGAFFPGETKPLPVGAVMPPLALVRNGDLLITRSNTPDRVGYVCRARDVPPETYMPDLIWRLCPDASVCDPEFLE